MPKTALAELTAGAQQVTYARGAIILRPGSRSRPGILTAGSVRAFLQGRDGRQATIQYGSPGDAIGIAHHFDPDTTVSVQALAQVTVLHFEGAALEDLMSRDGRVAVVVANLLASRVAASARYMRSHVFGSAGHRLASHLLLLAETDTAGQLVARVGQQELADAIGSVREHVARLLRDLRRRKVVTTSRSFVVILDRAALQSEAALE